MTRYVRLAALAAVLLTTGPATSAQRTASVAGTIAHHTVPSAALQGNLLGDPAESRVAVYLPPGYTEASERRYPTLYLLHGYLDSPESFGTQEGRPGYQGMQLASMMDDRIGGGAVREMIVVVPNGRNGYFGSFYANSPVTGGWEDFIASELVAWVDANYHTVSSPDGRGIAGHSMGGYGAIMLAMKHPDVFGAVYALSPCCLGLEADLGRDNPAWRQALRFRSREELHPKPQSLDEFYSTAFIALSAALSPNPAAKELYVDLPFQESNGQLIVNESAYARWRANMPLYLVEQYRTHLEKLDGIYLDYGALEQFSHIRETTRAFAEALASRGIAHTFEVYAAGNHGNRIRERLETRVLRFFSEVLRAP